MDAKTFNLKCAEFMGYSFVEHSIGKYDRYLGALILKDKAHLMFNPHSDANDRNKVIEKLRIETSIIETNIWDDPIWVCKVIGTNRDIRGGSMRVAQIRCIEVVLGE